MIRTVKQLLYITRTSTQLAEQMAEIVSDETWKQQFILYLEDITRQYKLWQYIHYLLAGTYEESDSEKIVTASVSELLYALCSNELKKGMLCRKASEMLSGAAQKAADHSLQQAIQYSQLFFTMIKNQLVHQIGR
ncbi:hypothetical protein [Parageobacillus toebii]|uniref:hypothetical protein n=1 Tax=Parageobacillus toebii TaxID=153151 RepID=UPI0035B56122